MSKEIALANNLIASAVMQSIKESRNYSDEELYSKFSIPVSIFHFHGGESPEIAWNNVQASIYYNTYSDRPDKIEIPAYPTEGYNQHSHTSEFDGGAIAGLLGVHTHKSSKQADGGLAFAVFAPSSGVNMVDWE